MVKKLELLEKLNYKNILIILTYFISQSLCMTVDFEDYPVVSSKTKVPC